MLHRHASAAVAVNYLAGAIAGAHVTAIGLLLLGGLASPLPVDLRYALVGIGLLGLALTAAGVISPNLPYRRYQIPRTVFHRSPGAAARRFAFELGTGVRTYVTNPSPYGLILVLVLAGPSSLGRAIMWTTAVAIGFGIGRSIVVAQDSLTGRVAIEPPVGALKFAGWLSLVGSAYVLYSAWV